MNANISHLQSERVSIFYRVFSEILHTQFPGYLPKVIDFLLHQIYNPTQISMWIKQGNKIVLVAEHNAEIVGFAMLDSLYGGVSFCRWLGVLPAYQRQGIGTKLIQQWENMAYDQGAHKLEVVGQPTAKKFYEKMGLQLEGFRKSSYFGIDQHLFGKVLQAPSEEVMTK